MATRLKRLRITRSDLVDKGANYDPLTGEGAHVLLYKRDEAAVDPEPDDDPTPATPEAVEEDQPAEEGVDRDDPQEPVVVTETPVDSIDKMNEGMPEYGDMPAMPDDLLASRRAHEAFCEVHQAFMDSFYTIMNQAPAADQPKLLQQAVGQFAAQMKNLTPDVRKSLPESGQDALEVLEGVTQSFAKVGAKISQARMKRLQAAMEALKAIMDEQQGDPAMQETEKKAFEAQIDALKKRAETAEGEKTTLETTLATVQGEVSALKEMVEKKEVHPPITPEADPEKVWKGVSPMLRKMFEDQEVINKHLAEEVKIEKERRERQEFITLVKTFDHLPMNPDDDWVTLRDIRAMPTKTAERVETLLRIANDFAKSSRQFVEIGHAQVPNGDGSQPGTRFMALVNNAIAKGDAKTVDEAMQLVNKMNPGMYAEYAAEQRRRARAGD